MSGTLNRYDLTGRTALITGAAGFLGVEHAAALLESGATVVLTDINETALESARESLAQDNNEERVISQVMNVTQHASVRATLEQIEADGRRLDILVNNAAIDPKFDDNEGISAESRLEDFPLEQWDMQMAVGLTGAFLCSQVFGTAMASDGKGGVILNIASDLSVVAPYQRLYRLEGVAEASQPVKPVTYSVIKTGLIGLTRYLATYWANRGVRANALSPGGVYDGQDEGFVQRLSSLIPLGRMASRDEYRAAVQFLCSDASAYMSGQNIVMDGGRSVW